MKIPPKEDVNYDIWVVGAQTKRFKESFGETASTDKMFCSYNGFCRMEKL